MITTAGGLIFAGRFNGQLTALDSDTGQRLWSFQTDGGFTTTATTFEHEGVLYAVPGDNDVFAVDVKTG